MCSFIELQMQRAACDCKNTSSVLLGHRVHVAGLKKQTKKHQLQMKYQARLYLG